LKEEGDISNFNHILRFQRKLRRRSLSGNSESHTKSYAVNLE